MHKEKRLAHSSGGSSTWCQHLLNCGEGLLGWVTAWQMASWQQHTEEAHIARQKARRVCEVKLTL
jgi:hypothetical protein